MRLKYGWSLLIALPLSTWAGVLLQNQEWRVEMEPTTLAINVAPADSPKIELSEGVAPHTVSALKQEGSHASWQWDNGRYHWQASLDGHDLRLTLRANAVGQVALLRQPVAAMGRGLLLPLAEGSYIPTGSKIWQDFLPGFAPGGLDTTEKLSLPLWGMDYGRYSLHWLLLNPFNNHLNVKAQGAGLALALSHDFNALNQNQPLTLLLHLGDNNLLAGAERYRQWLITEGRYQTLTDKIQQQPDTAKLIGASHIYLWGNDLLDASDVRNWQTFITLLRSNVPLAEKLRGHFDAETRQILQQVGAQPNQYQQRVLMDAFNQALCAEARTQWLKPKPEWAHMAEPYRKLRSEVAQIFGPALDPDTAHWGGGLSLKTINTLQKAGLKRLWLGVDNWEGGLWQPQAVEAGVKAGYLMGSYDSYETAAPPDQRQDWLTAQLGTAVYRQCGVRLGNGNMKAGFQQTGYYTNPDCVRDTLQQRMSALLPATHFNSWFLDAYGTGMVFDDYTPGHRTSQAQMAVGYERSMQWATHHFKLPLGSENGNSTTTLGIAFGHGLQVPVLGWGDPQTRQDKQSPYYLNPKDLGRWYPANQPEIFFKPISLRQPYRDLYFAAQYRLPLYQAVFHGSVITTNFWGYDNLKFSNTYADNLLAQWLYNVPPLFHLSAPNLKTRLVTLVCTDNAFRPLHQQLATQALTGFAWLNASHTLQQTRFADGSRLTANFNQTPVRVGEKTLPPYSLLAELAGQPPRLLSVADCDSNSKRR